MECWSWDALSAIATGGATLVALGILVREMILRRQDEQRREKEGRDRRYVSLLEQILDTVVGRAFVGPKRTPEDQDRQYRAELRLPALITQLPDEYTILLRRSEDRGTINLRPHEWAIGIDPWKHHEAWDDLIPKAPALLAADILASIEAIETGQPKKYPKASDGN